ncbi:DUF2946 family protein [Thauera sinica]|uniref:DUF2946 family protein n=1 Tax=Thauera sinica TaxID=2665146 RepID=A0ABW1AQL9_9RHOO|nr:DUF2946 family protein [Thauera sp. K11]ATE62532.1 hypothetical protein CCZ27_07055 [Thauera sp. K11]
MSDAPIPAVAPHWPPVPACYGWLSLDRRGGWRLQREPVRHQGFVAFLNAHYGTDGSGAWLVRNGPQKVFVALDYTPWVLRLETDGRLTTHTGADAGRIDTVHIDDEGNVLLHAGCGIGLLDDRDLPRLLAQCRLADGAPAGDDALIALLAATAAPADVPAVRWRNLAVQPIRRAEVAQRFGFVPAPAPDPAPGSVP